MPDIRFIAQEVPVRYRVNGIIGPIIEYHNEYVVVGINTGLAYRKLIENNSDSQIDYYNLMHVGTGMAIYNQYVDTPEQAERWLALCAQYIDWNMVDVDISRSPGNILLYRLIGVARWEVLGQEKPGSTKECYDAYRLRLTQYLPSSALK